MSILDVSKVLMYDLWYNHLKRHYGDRCKLTYTDTDTLLIEVQMEDIYAHMAKQQHLYDTSDYPKDHRSKSLLTRRCWVR